ncbi:epimerase-domain-containing protein [Rickenella mellea]|uniref:GDP-L-fucose synthase n=1 Tax=Rickenella mellea TaxID=50990 RepID=A0A4Y7QKZ2_9AGAM|nr:epimerase-domain-containing protein [Rickenella mellea]
MSTPKVILVTGGSGLVGQAMRHVLFDEKTELAFRAQPDEVWHFMASKEADLRSPEETEKLFEKYKPTHVVHLAALVGGLFKNMSHNLSFLRDNILINDNVLNTSHKTNVQKVISCLSTCVFPDGAGAPPDLYPLTEAKIHLGPPHSSNFGYSHAKRLVDVQNRAYKEQYGRNYTSAIPTNIFGPHDNYDLRDSHVIPGLMHKCYLAEKNGTVFQPAGSGRPLRQFIYSHDLAKVFIWMLRHYDDVEPLIVSVSEEQEVSIEYVVNKVVAAFQKNRAARNEAAGSDGQFRKPTSNAKLRAVLEKSGVNFEFTPFEQALQESVDWFVENYETARTGDVNQVSLL